VKGATAEWHVTLPANTTGWLELSPSDAAKYKLDGVPLAESKSATATTRAGHSGYQLAPGAYTFMVGL